jgi:hypothetical protein
VQFSSPETKPQEPDRHDEIDFEFLGNTSGNPITVQTNVYLNGVGDREQHHYLPVDPAAAFHNYSLLWNQHLIMSVHTPSPSLNNHLLLTANPNPQKPLSNIHSSNHLPQINHP